MMAGKSLRRAWWVGALLALGACTSRVGQGEQCVFNDDCESPLVCSAARCRVQCRSDRDCPGDQLCAPSESPRKRVCVARTQEALCASDDACPAGSRCAGNACWWRCSTDPDCAARNAMTCMPAERLCVTPVTVLQQRELPPELFTPADAGPPADAASPADASAPTDVITPSDVVAMDAVTPSDAATADVPPADAPPADVPPAACMGDGDCFFANASGRCVSGLCALGACNAGFADCDRSATNGCEVSTQSDVRHCGACGRACNPAPNVATTACVGGACTRAACAEGFGDCNNQASDGCETNLRTSVAHCGACGAACPDYASTTLGGVATVCAASVCGYSMCASTRADCDGDVANGCEVDLLTSLAHCGACRSACTAGPNADASCTARRCVRTCRNGFGDCDADPSNGCERDLGADPEHCGACGRRCAGSEVCGAGVCMPGVHAAGDATEVLAPTMDVTLPSGVHRYASVNIPRGVTVRSGPPGILEIYARGEVRIDGTIDVSGGNGGNATTPAMDCAGGNGSGGETGTTIAGANGMSGMRAFGGGGGTGSEGGTGAGGLPGSGGAFGGGAGGHSVGVGAGAGGGGWAGGAGGGGGGGCTFCGSGQGGGTVYGGSDGGDGVGGGGGGQGGRTGATRDLYWGEDGVNAGVTGGGGGGGGGCIGSTASADPILVRDTFRPGSGGGGGGAPFGTSTGMCVFMSANGGGGGGGGGGALRIASATRIIVSSTGIVRADGGRGGAGAVGSRIPSGAGGGGSGGAIHLWSPSVTVQGRVSAAGGAGGTTAGVPGGGGAGGLGRVAISATTARCNLGGVFVPQLLNGCGLSIGPARVGIRGFP